MHNGYPIRSNLESDREKRPRYKELAKEQTFGIHRSVVPQDAAAIRYTLQELTPEVEKFLSDKRRPEVHMEVPRNFGLTYVMTRKVSERIQAAVANGFRLAQFVDTLQSNGIQPKSNELKTSVLELGWYGKKKRIGAAVLNKCIDVHSDIDEVCYCEKEMIGENAEKINYERDYLLEVLGEMGLKGVGTRVDHISLFELGLPSQRPKLEDYHRRHIGELVMDRLDSKNLFRIGLGPLTLGKEYNSSFEDADWDKHFSIELDETNQHAR